MKNQNIHVYPVKDLKPHNTEDGANCDCNPVIVSGEIEKSTGNWRIFGSKIIVHNAWDKRK